MKHVGRQMSVRSADWAEQPAILANLSSERFSSRTRSIPLRPASFVASALLATGLALAALTIEGSQSEWVKIPSWLVSMQSIGRPGALVALTAALVVFVNTRRGPMLRFFSGPASIVWLLNVLFIVKILVFGGDVQFVLVALCAAALQVLVLVQCVGREEFTIMFCDREGALTSADIAVFALAAVFALLNLMLLALSPEAVSAFHGRFYGTTANPQHTMMTAVLCLPTCLLYVRSKRLPALIRIGGAVVFFGLITVIFATGSRTGAACVAVIIAIFFRKFYRSKKILITIYILIISSLVFLIFFGDEFLNKVLMKISSVYVEDRSDTRSFWWMLELEVFMDNWVFGRELDEYGRLPFSVNYWLSVAANGGILAILFGLILLLYMIKTVLNLVVLQCGVVDSLKRDTLLALVVALLIISTFESVLAGLVATHTMLGTIHLTAAYQFIRARKFPRVYRR